MLHEEQINVWMPEKYSKITTSFTSTEAMLCQGENSMEDSLKFSGRKQIIIDLDMKHC